MTRTGSNILNIPFDRKSVKWIEKQSWITFSINTGTGSNSGGYYPLNK